MSKEDSKLTRRALKRIIFVISVLILINPIIIFLLFKNVFLALLIPVISIIFLLFIYENRNSKILVSLTINFLIIISFFLHAEVVFNYSFKDYNVENLYDIKFKYYFNRPFLNETFRDKEFLVNYKTNKQGFRIGSESDPEVIVKEVDWIFLGDSYTQGAQVQFEELYTSKLYEMFPDKVIINSGISGFGIPEEYHYFNNQAKKLKPKKVFLQICNFNDFMKVEEKRADVSEYLMSYSNFIRFILYRFKYSNPADLPLGRWAEPFYPDVESNSDYNIFYKEKSEIKERDLRNFEKYIEKLNNSVKGIGAELIVIQIPTKEQISYKYFNEVISSFDIDVKKLDMNFPNNLLKRICENNGLKYLDLYKSFASSGQSLFYEFDEHLNVSGHLFMAQKIKEFLNSNFQYSAKTKRLSALSLGDRYPRISDPDCNVLSYQSWRDGNMELFVGDSSMQNNRRITWNEVDESHPWMSRDNKKLIFTEGDQAENNTKVVVMNINTGERNYVTNEDNVYGSIPAYNSDGTKITYAEWLYDKKTKSYSNSYIVVYDLLKGDKEVLTTDNHESWRPIFSFNDQKIYYISNEFQGQFDIFSIDLNDKSIHRITDSPYDEWDPSVEIDGRFMIYSGRKENNWDLFLFDFRDSTSRQLTRSLGNEWDASFSPCSQNILYAGEYGLNNGIYNLDISQYHN